ncbi:MAG: hypothetical protein GF311_10550, partial [Candidatus Lokiarchaeota archaeon]|nr:hypothetical protein [Candidatus Lokiarchaeota archaeon]
MVSSKMEGAERLKMRPKSTLYFELSDPKYIEMFFTLKKEISKEQLGNNKKGNISNVQ